MCVQILKRFGCPYSREIGQSHLLHQAFCSHPRPEPLSDSQRVASKGDSQELTWANRNLPQGKKRESYLARKICKRRVRQTAKHFLQWISLKPAFGCIRKEFAARKTVQRCVLQGFLNGTPGGTRTPNLLIRRLSVLMVLLFIYSGLWGRVSMSGSRPILALHVKPFLRGHHLGMTSEWFQRSIHKRIGLRVQF